MAAELGCQRQNALGLGKPTVGFLAANFRSVLRQNLLHLFRRVTTSKSTLRVSKCLRPQRIFFRLDIPQLFKILCAFVPAPEQHRVNSCLKNRPNGIVCTERRFRF